MVASRSTKTVFVLVLLFCAPFARAGVIDSTANGFTVKNSVTIVGSTPDQVYSHLVKDVGMWWSSAHTWSQNAANLSIDDKAGGGFREKLASGGSVLHLTVVYADPGKTLRMSGGLGPLQTLAVAGTMTWAFSKQGDGTQVELTYTIGGYRPGGLAFLAPLVDKVLLEQLTRFKSYVEHGKPE